jgi:hypothetical protein
MDHVDNVQPVLHTINKNKLVMLYVQKPMKFMMVKIVFAHLTFIKLMVYAVNVK